MAYTIRILTDARTDVFEIIHYYNSQKAGLGSEWFAAFQDTLRAIATHPTLTQKVYKQARRQRIQRFPHRVFYLTKVRRKEVWVFAVKHEKQHPHQWKQQYEI